MGMYNIINLRKNCPKCYSKVEWQTKDLVIDDKYPVTNVLKKYSINKSMNADIYTSCDNCKTWSEATIINGKLKNLKSGSPKD